MRGVVLAAGKGERLRPLTEALPKALLPIDGDRTILDVVLANLAAVDVDEVLLVTGFAADEIAARRTALEERHGVRLSLEDNPRAQEWNNAYSLWLAREWLAGGALVVNGDTVHPVAVERRLLAADDTEGLVLAVDADKRLGAEEMKVELHADGTLRRVNKAIAPERAAGEYIGVSLVRPAVAVALADALEATWRADPSLYYEDGYQRYVDRGGRVATVPIGTSDWVEVDDHADLARAREVACRC